MAPGQLLFDAALALEQPVHGGVELVFIGALQVQLLAQGVAQRLGAELTRGGELRARVEHARHHHRHHEAALAAR